MEIVVVSRLEMGTIHELGLQQLNCLDERTSQPSEQLVVGDGKSRILLIFWHASQKPADNEAARLRLPDRSNMFSRALSSR